MKEHKIGRPFICVFTTMAMAACGHTSSSDADIATALSSPTDTIAWENLPTEEIIPIPYGMAVSNSTIAAFGKYQDYWVHTYDITTGKSIASFMHEGHGPGEITSGSVMNSINDSLISVYDYGQSRLNIANITNGSLLQSTSLANIATVISDAWALSEQKALVKYPHRFSEETLSRAFAIVDLQSQKVEDEYSDHPEAFAENAIMLSSQPGLALSPDKKHFASTTMVGGTLETFEIDDGKIIPITSSVIHPTKYVKNGNLLQPENPIYVFLYSCASDKHFYTSYANSEDPNQATKIAVWDWNGNLLHCYETGKLIFKMAYDVASGDIYGIIIDGPGPRLARLSKKI